MVGRNKNWTAPSDWMMEFNRVHNPWMFEDEKKTNKKKTKSKK